MGLRPDMGWDKPFVYGPLLAALHWRITLWLPLAAQTLLVSYILWLTLAVFARPRWPQHLALCALLAACTTAPWVTSTLMPDLFTPVAILSILILAAPRRCIPRAHRVAVGVVLAIAIAAHLSNLIVSAASIVTAAILFRTLPWRPILSLASAIAFLLVSNAIGHGKFGISPYGSVFALARLVGDGPARDYLDRVCPGAGYALCAWKGRLTADSDQFLWDPGGPFWTDDRPVGDFAAEAAQIVAATIASDPLRVLADAARNAARQLGRFQLGDTLVSAYLDTAVRPPIETWFPPAELRRYDASLQSRDRLTASAAPSILITSVFSALAALICVFVLLRSLAAPTTLADLTGLILIALAANALATGALSTVHDRYQSRAIWLLALPAFLAVTTLRGSPAGQNRSGSHLPPPA